jgi:chromosome partitioning protein
VGVAELELQATQGIAALADALSACADRWDLVICDCPPSLGYLSTNALFAAQTVLVPIVLQKLPLDGLGQLRETILRIRRLNPVLRVGAVFGVNSDPRTLLARAVIEAIKALPEFGAFASTLIRRDTTLGAAVGHAPITVYAPNSNGAADYRALANELVTMGALQ